VQDGWLMWNAALDAAATRTQGADDARPMAIDAVLAAVDRMCMPLDESRLSGVTAQEDARCMALIRDYVLATRDTATRAQAPDLAADPLAILMHHAADECMSPDQRDLFDKLGSGDNDSDVYERLFRCVLKRAPGAQAPDSAALKQIASLCMGYVATGGSAWQCGANDMAIKVLELIAPSAHATKETS
jgi:hypothetical protein